MNKKSRRFKMKRLLLVSVFFAAIAASAEEKPKFDIGITGVAYTTNYSSVVKDEKGDYSAVRLNPLFTFKNGGTEAVVELEYNATFGAETSADEDDSLNTGVGAGKKGVQVVQAYGKLNSEALPGLYITGGIAPYNFPLILDDSIPMFSAGYTSDAADLAIYYMQLYEGDNNDSTDDVEIYAADITLKFSESQIKPAIVVNKAEQNSEGIFRNSLAYMPAVSILLSFGSVGLNASAVYITGEDKINERDYKAYAFDIAPYIKAGESFSISGFFTMVSGDDDTTDDEDSSFLNSTIDGAGSGINSFRLYIVEDGGSFTENSDVADAGKYSNTSGYLAAGLSSEITLGSVKTVLQGAYVKAHKAASGQSKDMGIELDLNIAYTFSNNAALFAEAAYLAAGDFYENSGAEKQNASYMSFGMTLEI